MTGVLGVGLSAKKGRADLADFAAHLDDLAGLGCDTVELPLYDMDVVVGGRIRRPQLEVLKAACGRQSLRYTVHGPLAINFFDDPYRLPRHFEVLKASMEAAAELSAIHYVMHAGLIRIQQFPGIEDAYARQREWLARAGELARELDLHLCVENLFPGFNGVAHTPTPSRLAAELRTVDHPYVKATLDFGHAYLQLGYQGGDLISEVVALAPLARHVHVHDNFGRADDIWTFTVGEKLALGHGDLHLPVGWGDLPWDRFMSECEFPEGVVFNIELPERYWYAVHDCLNATRSLAARARTPGRSRS